MAGFWRRPEYFLYQEVSGKPTFPFIFYGRIFQQGLEQFLHKKR